MKTPMTDELDEVSCVMSDEETVKAYKRLCRKLEEQAGKWQTVAAQASAEREHNAMQAQKWKAECDVMRDLVGRATCLHDRNLELAEEIQGLKTQAVKWRAVAEGLAGELEAVRICCGGKVLSRVDAALAVFERAKKEEKSL